MVSTITTAASTTTLNGLTESLAITVLLSLVYMLIHKEIANEHIDERWHRFNQALNILIIPLTLCFFTIAFAKVASYIS